MQKLKKYLLLSLLPVLVTGCFMQPKNSNTSQIKDSTSESQNTATIIVKNGTGSGVYEIGDEATISTVVPDYKSFGYWESEGRSVSTSNPYTFTVTKSATFEAKFTNLKGVLTVINGTGSGTYDLGSQVTVTATPGENEEFVRWEIGNQSVSTSSTYTFTLTADTTITAVMKTKADPSDYVLSYTKTLKMTGDSFKVLNLTDIQLCDSDTIDITKHVIDTLVERVHPDMITFLGDILNDVKDTDAKVTPKAALKYIDSLGIPWAPVFGNHDSLEYGGAATSGRTVGVDYLINIFKECENCLFVEGPSNVLGKSNYVVDIVDSETNDYVESFIFFDSFTSGLQESHVTFYEDIVNSLRKRNNNVNVPTVLFDHIPLQQYKDARDNTEAVEYRDVIGCAYGQILAAGTADLFPKIKSLGSTKTVICGHDHENAYYTTYDGVKLAYAMKSSEGDDKDGVNYKHGLGGLVLTIDGENEDKLNYEKVEDLGYTFGEGCSVTSYDFHPDVLPYWRYSGAKLKFDIELPSTGSIDFNIQGTNLFASSNQTGAWNRLTNNATINASDKTIDYGTLTLISGNKYRCEVDVTSYNLNTTDSVKSCGDETARIVYFWHASGKFTISNLRYEFEKITETNQIDLSSAVIANIEDQTYLKGKPVKPTPDVTLSGSKLNLVDDILLTYENNIEAGTATLKVVPSGKGAHKYKGSISKTFNILANSWRGELFEKGYQHSFTAKTIATDKLEFDVHFTSTGENTMKFMIGDGWDSLFGYYGLKNDGTLEDNYSGITVSATSDEYYHVTCVLKNLTKQNGSTPLPTTTVNLFYIHGSWGNNPKGYIDFDTSGSAEVLRGETFTAGVDKTFTFSKLTYDDTIKVDFKLTSKTGTHVSFCVGNTMSDWDYYFGYYGFYVGGTLGDSYSGISVSTTDDGYYRLTIVLGELTKASKAGGPSAEAGFNLFYIRGNWTDASGYVDFNPQESTTPTEKTNEFTMKDDDFVIANFTDIHVNSEDLLSDTGTVGKTIKYAIQNTNPDILVFSGDVAGSSSDLNYIFNYLDGFKIPYFIILGNHDHEGSLGYSTIANAINKSQYGYIDKGPDGLDSEGNYTVNIKNSQGSLVHSLVMMDSGNKCDVQNESAVEYATSKVSGVKYGSYGGNSTYCDSTSYNSKEGSWKGVRGAQIDWYKNTVQSLGCETTLITHMPFNEYVKAYEQYQDAKNKSDQTKINECAPIGNCKMGEQCCGPIENTGLFDSILEKGSTKNVICGHDHCNDFSLMYQGVRLTYAVKTGEGSYWDKTGATNGYTTLTINSSGNATLNQIYLNPLS